MQTVEYYGMLYCRRHPLVQRALDVGFAFLQNNFVRVFRLTDQLSALERCALLPHITQIRRYVLENKCSSIHVEHSASTQQGDRPVARCTGSDVIIVVLRVYMQQSEHEHRD